MGKTTNFEEFNSTKKYQRELDSFYENDGELKPFIYQTKIYKMLELMKSLNYSEVSIRRVINEIKDKNIETEKEISEDLIYDLKNNLFSEEELSTLDYASLIVSSKEDIYKGFVSTLTSKLAEIKYLFNLRIKSKDEVECEIIESLIRDCYEVIDENVYNFYNVHKASIGIVR